jgi:ATP-binding cassette, subfamily B, multidrug efflux pump
METIMGKLIKYLAEHKLAVFIILLLLVVQAFCDLSLPSYTSDIVDVGIQQSGIEGAAAEKYTQKTYEALKIFMNDEDIAYMDECYDADGEVYVRRNLSSKELDKLNNTLLTAAGMVYSVQTSGQYSIAELVDGYNAGLVTREALSALTQQVEAAMGDMAASMKSQMAVELVKSEYTALNYDLNAIQRHYLLIMGAKMLAMTLLMVAAAIGVGFIGARTAAAIGRDLREKLFTKVIGFSNADINKFSTASLITRSTNDVQQVQQVSVMMLRIVLYAPIIGMGGIIKVTGTDTGMGWIIGVAVGAVLSLVLVLMVVAMPKFKKMQSLVDRVNLVSREILTGTMVIRAFSREKHEEERFDKANKDLMSTQLFTNRVMSIMMPAMMLIMNAITVLIVWMGAKGIDIGRMQVGDMMAFITYTMQIVMAFLMITMISVMLPRAGVAADRIEEVLNTKETIEDKPDACETDKKLACCKGVVEFKNVSFRFDGGSENAISNLTFKAEPGKTTAIIGSTGCGKSTVVNLLDRFYDVTEGSITLDGVDIRDISQKELRSHIGLVPQKGVLFSGTIESNIKYGGDFVTDEDMKEAAAIAQATEFIDSKKDGYADSIAQGGTNVSGGQKQRLSIARAIAVRPKVYVFDDSFSALDFKTDAALRKALSARTKDASVIIVAQRISTIMNADQIILLNEGKVAGIGTHKELLKNCPEYLEIAKSQLSEAELAGEEA